MKAIHDDMEKMKIHDLDPASPALALYSDRLQMECWGGYSGEWLRSSHMVGYSVQTSDTSETTSTLA